MVDKILGSNADVTNLLFTMTEGIGKPLRPVDGTTGGGGTVTIVQEELLRAQSFVTQQPGALNTPITVTFGDAQTTPTWDLSAGGVFTCNETDEYSLNIRLQFGREGAGAAAVMYARMVVNGSQFGSTVYNRIDTGDDVNIATFNFTAAFTAGDVMSVQIMRSVQGTSAGGVFAGNPNLAGWQQAASASMVIERTRAVQT